MPDLSQRCNLNKRLNKHRKTVKILHVSDLHGSSAAYEKLCSLIKAVKPDVVVISGDFMGRGLIPILKRDSTYEVLPGKSVLGGTLQIDVGVKVVGDAALEDLMRRLRTQGLYPRVFTEKEFGEVVDKGLIRDVLVREILRVFEEDLRRIESSCKEAGCRVFAIPGNYDYHEVADRLNSLESDIIKPIEEKIVEYGGYIFMGFGYTSPTPFNTPRELPDEEIKARLESLFRQVDVSRLRRVILVSHDPPRDTKLDVVRMGEKEVHVGSKSVREIIETYAPLIGLHGHIHESSGIDFIRTGKDVVVPVINPGSEFMRGILRYVVLTIDGERLSSYEFGQV